MKKIKRKLIVLMLGLAMSGMVGLSSLIPEANLTYASPEDVDCLAKNIYMEARGESVEGQIAVAQVTVNRVKSGKFQSTVCKAVYARKQFSWTIKKVASIKDDKAWAAALEISKAVLTNSIVLPDFNALYYHTKKVNPAWNRDKLVVAVIGQHIFYT